MQKKNWWFKQNFNYLTVGTRKHPPDDELITGESDDVTRTIRRLIEVRGSYMRTWSSHVDSLVDGGKWDLYQKLQKYGRDWRENVLVSSLLFILFCFNPSEWFDDSWTLNHKKASSAGCLSAVTGAKGRMSDWWAAGGKGKRNQVKQINGGERWKRGF